MTSPWTPKWPFLSRDAVLAHERVYLAGVWQPPNGRRITIGTQPDLELESWLGNEGAVQLQERQTHEAVRGVYVWKMRATLEAAEKCPEPPPALLGPEFAAALRDCRSPHSDVALAEGMLALTTFAGVGVRVASAFLYWLQPDNLQVIDRRATQALNLSFADSDYTIDNYLWYCRYSRALADEHRLSLRQIDRALFTYQKLLDRPSPVVLAV